MAKNGQGDFWAIFGHFGHFLGHFLPRAPQDDLIITPKLWQRALTYGPFLKPGSTWEAVWESCDTEHSIYLETMLMKTHNWAGNEMWIWIVNDVINSCISPVALDRGGLLITHSAQQQQGHIWLKVNSNIQCKHAITSTPVSKGGRKIRNPISWKSQSSEFFNLGIFADLAFSSMATS